MNLDLSQLADDTRCALLIGSGDMTLGELRRALGGQPADLLNMEPEDMTEDQMLEATIQMWGQRATENYTGRPGRT